MSKEMIIGIIQSGHDQLVRTVEATPDDKMQWKPLDNGRTALDLLCDAAQTAKMTHQMLESKGDFKPSREAFQALKAEAAAWTREDAMQQLKDNTAQLLEALRNVPDEVLEQPLHLPMGGGITLPLGSWMMMAYRTFVSRMAQINYIQTLYGDFDSH